jgi:tetratricopeptide (TPR) repeat protein
MWAALIGVIALIASATPRAIAQPAASKDAPGAPITGRVLDQYSKPVAFASVLVEGKPALSSSTTKTGAKGEFAFPAVQAGTYLVSAERDGVRSNVATVTVSSDRTPQEIHLTLPSTANAGAAASSSGAMEFADQPNFTVAGVTDWTAVGGHGSDAVLRTSEELARDTATLKPGTSSSQSASSAGAYRQGAEHRMAGEAAEKSGDPLGAVHELERAARLDPSEQNYFEWGSELLLHRAVWQAVEVFGEGTKAYPKSARMLAALGAALFASARYDEAARHLCDASDLDPNDTEPYIFLGKIEIAAPSPLPCVEEKLARFLKQQPNSSSANYLYAMALLKGQSSSADQAALQRADALLTRAAALDPKCAEAYLELGIQSYAGHDVEKAIGYYGKAIDANPQLAEAHYRLGVAYDRIGDPARAAQEFQLHDEIEKRDAEAVERERREIKQFLIVLQGQPAIPPGR